MTDWQLVETSCYKRKNLGRTGKITDILVQELLEISCYERKKARRIKIVSDILGQELGNVEDPKG